MKASADPSGVALGGPLAVLAGDLRRQRMARRIVAVGLAGAAGLTALVLASVSGPPQPPSVAAVPSGAVSAGGVTSAGVSPALQPPAVAR